jgi:hypothetical protein
MSFDIEGARQALFTYCRGVDRLDPELVRAAFWPEAEIALGSIYSGGPEGFVEVAMGFMGMFAATRHDLGNLLVSADGGYEGYVRTWHWLTDPDRELLVLGRYLGRAETRGEETRIIAHGELMDWGEERPVDAGWFGANSELEKGRRDRADVSYRWIASRK